VNGRRRRVYQVTRKGLRALTQQQEQWRDFSRAVEKVVEGLA
jgi:DNA-binding PadR family transcriptional regulator